MPVYIENMVPQDAHAEIVVPNADEVVDRFFAYVAANPVEGSAQVVRRQSYLRRCW